MNTKFDHSGSERARIQAEQLRCTTWTFNAPPGLFQYVEDIFPLDLSQAFDGVWCLFPGRLCQIDDMQNVSLRINNSSLDYVSQFPYVPGPRVGLQVFHRPGRDRLDRLPELLGIAADKM